MNRVAAVVTMGLTVATTIARVHAQTARAGESLTLTAPTAVAAPREFSASLTAVWSRPIDVANAPLVADRDGIVTALTKASDLVELGADGVETARVHLPGEVTRGPVLLPSGDHAFLTRSGECIVLTQTGRLRFRRVITGVERELTSLLAVTSRATLLVASGRRLLEINDAGDILRDTQLDTPPVAIVEDPAGVALGIDAAGSIYRWSAPYAPRVIGSFGGTVQDASPGRTRSILRAVVDGTRLVAFDVSSGARTTLARADTSRFAGPPIEDSSGAIWAVLDDGVLLRIANDVSAPVLYAFPDAAPTLRGSLGAAGSRVLLADQSGHVAFARGDGVLFVLGANAEHATVPTCREPFALAGSASGRIYVSCRDGAITAYAGR